MPLSLNKRASVAANIAELVEQPFRCDQIGRLETFGKPGVKRTANLLRDSTRPTCGLRSPCLNHFQVAALRIIFGQFWTTYGWLGWVLGAIASP
jgi:hypothetical protein